MSYDVSYGAISSLYAGTAPAAAELNGKVNYSCFQFRQTGNGLPFSVSYYLGTCHASPPEGSRYRAREETVGMV
jgi:hypothetical protein